MPNIFISYRREESAYVAAAVAEKLAGRFGAKSVFLDIDNIPIGVDFLQYLHGAIVHADIVLVLIGDHWINSANEDGHRRLDSPTDFVRIELEFALSQGIHIVPVLIGNARMPRAAELPDSLKALAHRNATELRPGKEFLPHVTRLVDICANYPKLVSRISPARRKTTPTVQTLHALHGQITNVFPHKSFWKFIDALTWNQQPRTAIGKIFQICFFFGAILTLLYTGVMSLGLVILYANPGAGGPPSLFVSLLFLTSPWMFLYFFVWGLGRVLDDSFDSEKPRS